MHKVVASDGAADDYFGRSVSIYNDTAIVGAYYNDDNGNDSGSVYVFSMANGTWIQTQKLTVFDAATGDYFGVSAGIFGDDAMIGANSDDDTGSVYAFERTNEYGEWTFHQKLFADDKASSGDGFGDTISIYNTTAIIGNQKHTSDTGAAYVFVKEYGIWTQQAKLTDTNGATGDRFGYSVSVYGEWCLVGAYNDDDMGTDSGTVFLFKRTNGNWSLYQTLYANDANSYDYFGISVSMYGDYALIGSPSNDDNGNDSGSAYVFELSGGVWSQTNKLTASDAAEGDWFGWSLSVYEQYTVIGSLFDGDSYSGCVYIFERISYAIWTQIQKITANDEGEDNQFGMYVSMYDKHFIVSAMADDDMGGDAGAVYIMTSYYSCNNVWNEPSYDQSTLLGTNNTYLVNYTWESCLFTDNPTTDPTIEPTEPSFDPTIEPTINPTNDPSTDPSIAPISDPSTDPTTDPTTEPTMRPTKAPTTSADGTSAQMYMSAVVFAFAAVICL